MTFRTCTC